MIQPIQHRTAETVETTDPGQDVVSIEDMVRQFAVQNFVQALMGGDPELTGIPDLTAQDG